MNGTDTLQSLLEEYVTAFGAIGALAAIDVPGRPRVHLSAGRRSLRDEEPIAPGHLYQIGSQTKTLLAVAILLLARDGKLALDDSVVRHLELPIDERITVRHLITNTSGLGEPTDFLFGPWFDPGARLAPRDVVSMVLTQGQIFPPGERFDYCNTGWTIAAMLLDALTGEGYARFLRARIFVPLGLEDFHVAAERNLPVDRMASGYFISPRTGRLLDSAFEVTLDWTYGAGDIIGSCDGLLDFYRALLAPGNAIGISLADLTAETHKAAPRPKFALSLGTEYGFGVERRTWPGRPVWGHPGRTPGYATGTWCDPASGAAVTTLVTSVRDTTEGPELAAVRYNAPRLFTVAMLTADALGRGTA